MTRIEIEDFEYTGLREAFIEVSFKDIETGKTIHLRGLVEEVEEVEE